MADADFTPDDLLVKAFLGLEGVPRPRMTPGGFFEFDVADVEAAVALAQRLKDGGRYTHFRGQCDAAWSVRSSFARRSVEERAAANAAFDAFRRWVRSSAELVPYLAHDDQIIAAAQHHGVCPTTFLDLTEDPEVAGWFATDGEGKGAQGALYLIDRAQLEPVFEGFSSDDLILRFVEVDVPNLWRLQAQSGIFLECTTDLDRIWPLDRIVFRQDGGPSRLDRARIYPADRSQLEQMIDQHQLLKRREDTMAELASDSGAQFIQIEAPDTAPPEFDAVRPRDRAEAWAAGPDERWDRIDADAPDERWTPAALREDTGALEQLIERRRSATRLLGVDDSDARVRDRLQALVDRTWAGMRPYPYDAAAIARAITAVARLEAPFRDYDLGAGNGTMPVALTVLADPVEIEFGIAGGGASRACVSGARLLRALSADAREHLKLSPDATGDTVLTRLAPYWGATLSCFDPGRLDGLFLDEIIPWQVVSKRDPIAFSPHHIKTLGRP
ncbi:MAG: FRG domain-containing protein [Pseudomonadota bacterium]